MATRLDSRFTIGHGMIVVAAVALMVYAGQRPGIWSFAISYLTLGVTLILTVILVVRRIVERNLGIICPACGHPGLERRSLLSFGERFYQCPDCGVRCRRGFLVGILGLNVWEDASTTEFQDHFARPRAEDPWNAPPGLEDEDVIVSKTHANLVRNKRRRSPENPNGPGLE